MSAHCRMCGAEIETDWDRRVDHLSQEHDMFQIVVETMTTEGEL